MLFVLNIIIEGMLCSQGLLMAVLGKWGSQKLAVHISVQVYLIDLICLHILRKRKNTLNTEHTTD